MKESYIQHFQDEEDKIEGATYLVWRRFKRTGLIDDVLSIELPESILCISSDTIDQSVSLAELLSKKRFRNFTNDEISLIQSGRIVSLKEGGLSENQTNYYKLLRDHLIGRGVVFDYFACLRGDNNYDLAEIIQVAQDPYFENVVKALGDINFILGITAPLRGAVEPQQIPKKPEDGEIPPPTGARSYDEVLEMTERTNKKIDGWLRKRI